MKPKFSLRLKYSFDNVMSRGLIALIGLLGTASLIFIFVVAAVVVLLGLHPADGTLDFPEAFWASLLRTLDPGTMGQDQGSGFRAAMLVVTLGGLIIVASLIGIISNAFNNKVEQLRKGRSRVLETEHTLILGWNSKVIPVLKELVVANASRSKPSVVILADRDKVEMEDEIQAALKHHGNTRIIVRSGDPMNLVDLEMTSHTSARSVIILSPDDPEEADNYSIKTALALVNNKERSSSSYHIVGEIRNAHNLEAATLVGGDEATWVLGEELISRLLVQTCRQSGLSAVFSDLLDFEGSEVYLAPVESLAGLTYKYVSLSFREAAVLGLVRDGGVLLNPPAATVAEANDLVILLAEDDTRLSFGRVAEVDADKICVTEHQLPKPEGTLILGNNQSLPLILRELDSCMAKGSKVKIVDDSNLPELGDFANAKADFVIADPTSRAVLEAAEVTSFNHVIVLADREAKSVQKADAKTLLTLLHLRGMVKSQNRSINIVSEMLDDRNRELAEATDADDFIVSDKLVSLMLTQISENQQVKDVFASLFASEGSQVRLHPAEWYVKLGAEVNFDTVSAAASQRDESAMGYRLSRLDTSDDSMHGVRLNPTRNQSVIFEPGDMVVVLTED